MGWGKLKSGAGWISLDYAVRVKNILEIAACLWVLFCVPAGIAFLQGIL